jgi:hypothetical protein
VDRDVNAAIAVRAVVCRKQDDLPRFVVIPSAVLAPWALTETTTIDVTINGAPGEPRTVKPWDEDRWFVSITQRDCTRGGFDTGSVVDLTLTRKPETLPLALSTLLKADPRARAAWEQLTAGQQRMLRDHVATAKQATTAVRRARRGLLGAD